MDASQLAEEITRAQSDLREAVAGIPNQRLEQEAALGAWPVTSVAAHTAEWLDDTLLAVEAGLRGVIAVGQPIADGEQYNQACASKYASWSWPDLLAHLDARFAAASEAASGLSNEELATQITMAWGGDGTVRDAFLGIVEHHDEHIADIRRWTESTKA